MIKCFCCFKELKTAFGSSDNIIAGTSLKFEGNYGSDYDCDYGTIYICDSCVASRVGTIFYFDGNYMDEHYATDKDYVAKKS